MCIYTTKFNFANKKLQLAKLLQLLITEFPFDVWYSHDSIKSIFRRAHTP